MSKIESALIDQLSGLVLWKDMNSVYLKANANLAPFLGLRHADELTGIRGTDIRCGAAKPVKKLQWDF